MLLGLYVNQYVVNISDVVHDCVFIGCAAVVVACFSAAGAVFGATGG